jgi:hypothetical protein
MFLRSTNRRKDGKDHRYFSIVENRRVPDGRTVQRTVLYLGEINDQQQACAPQKVHTTLTPRVSRANTRGEVRRERQRVERRGPQEYGGDEHSPAGAAAMPQGFPVQDSCAA